MLQGPKGLVSVDSVSELRSDNRKVIILTILKLDATTFAVALTDDHRMRLQHNVYRFARDLTRTVPELHVCRACRHPQLQQALMFRLACF